MLGTLRGNFRKMFEKFDGNFEEILRQMSDNFPEKYRRNSLCKDFTVFE